MTDTSLQPDCAQCAVLCCVAFAFERSADFAIDKPACTPCPNLQPSGMCGVYDERATLGFHGCIAHNCLGAGQRVTQEVFAGRHWQTDKALLQPMSEAFSDMLHLHRMLELLRVASVLPLLEEERRTLQTLLSLVDPAVGWSEATLKAASIGMIQGKVTSFLASLKHHVT